MCVYTCHISTKPFLRYLREPQEDCEAIAGVCAVAQSRGRRRDGSIGMGQFVAHKKMIFPLKMVIFPLKMVTFHSLW